MVAEAGGDMVCMEDQVVFFVCVKGLCLSGRLVLVFERELSPMVRKVRVKLVKKS
jgi:hypothetical protein